MATFMAPVTIDTANYRHGELSAWRTIGMDDHLQNTSTADYRHGWLPAWILLYIVIFLQDTSMDDHLQDIDTADYQHR